MQLHTHRLFETTIMGVSVILAEWDEQDSTVMWSGSIFA
jgi:hypothetical protein